jgi:lysophospholipase L1-like esterase
MKTFVLAVATSLWFASNLQAAANVVSTGDSLTCQISSDMPGALAAFGDFVYPDPIYGRGGSNTAMGGITSRQWIGSEPMNGQLIDFRANCIAANPDVVLLMIGTNDAFGDYGPNWNQWSLDTYKANVDAGVQSLTAEGTRVVLGTITPCNEEVAAAFRGSANSHPNVRFGLYNAWLQQEADLRNCLFLDTDTTMRKVPSWDTTMFGIDGVHYSPTGEIFMANQFAQAAELICQSDPVITAEAKINSLRVSSLHVLANLTADSIVADSLTIGGNPTAIPEPSALVLLSLLALGLAFKIARSRAGAENKRPEDSNAAAVACIRFRRGVGRQRVRPISLRPS